MAAARRNIAGMPRCAHRNHRKCTQHVKEISAKPLGLSRLDGRDTIMLLAGRYVIIRPLHHMPFRRGNAKYIS